MGMHKSLAVQAALLANPRKTMELVVCNKLSYFQSHACLGYFAEESNIPPALSAINLEAANLYALFDESEAGLMTWKDFGSLFHCRGVAAY